MMALSSLGAGGMSPEHPLTPQPPPTPTTNSTTHPSPSPINTPRSPRNTPSSPFRVLRSPRNEYGAPEYTTSVTSSGKYNCHDTRLPSSVYALKWMCAVLPGYHPDRPS